MARRKCKLRHSLAGSPAEHESALITARHEALQHAHDATVAMKKGKCLVAGTEIDKAYVELGKMMAHADGGGDFELVEKVRRAITSADEPFEEQCVRAMPVAGRASTRREVTSFAGLSRRKCTALSRSS